MVDLTIEFRKNKICFPGDKFRNSHWNVTLCSLIVVHESSGTLPKGNQSYPGAHQKLESTTVLPGTKQGDYTCNF